MKNHTEIVYNNIIKYIDKQIQKADFCTHLYYLLSEYDISQDSKKEIIDTVINAIEQNKIKYIPILNKVEFWLEKPIFTWGFKTTHLTLKNYPNSKILDKCEKIKNPIDVELEMLSYIYKCSKTVLNQLSKDDYNIAICLASLFYV